MNFESHIMPRLAKEYKDAGKKKIPFDLEKVKYKLKLNNE